MPDTPGGLQFSDQPADPATYLPPGAVTETDQYVIQVRSRKPDGLPPTPWTDYQPIEEGVSEQDRLMLLDSYRQRPAAAHWRLIRRTIREEIIEL